MGCYTTEISSASFRFRDEGGVELPLAGRQLGFSKDGARALHPGGFWRSLSRHSLRDVSKPRRHSTQPLVNGSQSTTAYRHRPFLHTQGVIRTAPPSRSRVNRVLATHHSAVKEKSHNYMDDKASFHYCHRSRKAAVLIT